MKNSVFLRGLAPLASCALLLPTATSAQTTSFTATGWVNQVLAPGIIGVNALGQVSLYVNVHTARVQGSDPRVTGQVFIIADGTFNADGSANVQGPGYLQVGTWDPAGTNFTPGAGLWVGNWRGVEQTNYSLQLSVASYGVGGTIDGWRLQETVTRGPAGGPVDTNVPYLYAGTIKPPPVSTNLISDNFDTNVLGWSAGYHCGNVRLYGTNQQLYTWADWTGCDPRNMDHFAFPYRTRDWNLTDGQTLECQADLVRISENSTNLAVVWAGHDDGMYVFDLGQTGVGLHKWHPATDPRVCFFWWDNTLHLPRTNLVLSLALTRNKGNLIVTTRVLDKANQNTVLFERTFTDTPGVDASLTSAELWALTGMTTFTLVPDQGLPAFSGGMEGVGMIQFSDGQQPPMEAIFDNYALRLHDEPPLSITPAVQLAWPAPASLNYSVEGAPTVQGPWLPVQELNVPGIQKLTVPLSGPAQFFRLVQAP